jgi:hypothetical protein
LDDQSRADGGVVGEKPNGVPAPGNFAEDD